jgi:hypothetical protein
MPLPRRGVPTKETLEIPLLRRGVRQKRLRNSPPEEGCPTKEALEMPLLRRDVRQKRL